MEKTELSHIEMSILVSQIDGERKKTKYSPNDHLMAETAAMNLIWTSDHDPFDSAKTKNFTEWANFVNDYHKALKIISNEDLRKTNKRVGLLHKYRQSESVSDLKELGIL